MNPPKTLDLYPGKSELHILPAISTEEMTDDDVESLKLRVHGLIESYILEHDRSFSELKKQKI